MSHPYTVAEVAEAERVTPKTIYKEIKERRLKARHVGAHLRIDAHELEAWRKRSLAKPEKRDTFDGVLKAAERGAR